MARRIRRTMARGGLLVRSSLSQAADYDIRPHANRLARRYRRLRLAGKTHAEAVREALW